MDAKEAGRKKHSAVDLLEFSASIDAPAGSRLRDEVTSEPLSTAVETSYEYGEPTLGSFAGSGATRACTLWRAIELFTVLAHKLM